MHRDHLGPAEHSVSFDVMLDNNGQVDSLAIRDSSLGDEELEKCMAIAIRSLSEDDLPLRRSDNRDHDPVAPESRAFVGHPEALAACLVSPQCVLVLTFLAGAAYITVTLYVQATSKPQPPPAKPHVEESTKKDPKPEGDPKTTGTTPPIPPEPSKRVPRCEVEWPTVVNCDDIRQKYRYPTRKEALEAAIRRLPKDRQTRPFTPSRTEKSRDLPFPGVDHTTYKSADGRTKISIGCYKQCCKDTQDGPDLEGGKCYELNREDLR